jgi:hypothetical protein
MTVPLRPVPFRLVCFRGRGFEAPAIIFSLDRNTDVADLVVFLMGDDANGCSMVTTVCVRDVARGNREGTEPRPSWYTIGAEADDRLV